VSLGKETHHLKRLKAKDLFWKGFGRQKLESVEGILEAVCYEYKNKTFLFTDVS